MFSIICLFAWLPDHYEFRAAIMAVFNITADQLVSIRKKRQHNMVIFRVASQEIFNSLSEFYCRILFFPILGHNILECFAYPKSPQYQFLSVSGNLDWILAGTRIRHLPGLGTVLYQCHLCDKVPLTSGFRNDRIGMVLRRRNESNDSVVRAADQHSRQRRRGSGRELQPAAGVPRLLAAAGLPQLFPMPARHHYFGNLPLQSVFPYQHEGSQIILFEANSEGPNRAIIRQHRNGFGHRNRSSWMTLSYRAEALRAMRLPQVPSSEDESSSVFPYQHEGLQIILSEPNLERPYNWNIGQRRGGSANRNRSSQMGLSYPAEAPRAILAPQEPSSEDECPSETPTAEDQNPESSSDKQE